MRVIHQQQNKIADLEQQLDLLKSIVKLDHPELEKVKHFESGLTVILDKYVETHAHELEEENEMLKRALWNASNFAIDNNELYEQVCEFKNKITEDYYGIDTDDIVNYFIYQAKGERK